MVNSVLDLMVSGVEAVISWWSVIMQRTGMASFYVTIMSVVLTLGILMTPLLGSSRAGLDAGSDKAAKWISDSRADRKHTTQHLQSVSRRR